MKVFSRKRFCLALSFLLTLSATLSVSANNLEEKSNEFASQQQKSRKLTGTVYDPSGEPIIGATVYLKGTTTGVTTNEDGKYSIVVPYNATLSFGFLGMTHQDVIYKGQEKLDITLKYDEKTTLGDVVVTGIFSKPRESFTGVVSTVKAEDLQLYKGQNLLQTLKNVDASINFNLNNLAGSNPNNLPQLSIRGNSSLPTSVQEYNAGVKESVNTPLIIMDGFEITLTKLMDYNDEEIESINILKDASATAIYGSRGANGVIVVISKAPKAGKLKVMAQIGINLEVPDLSSYNLLDAAGKLEVERLAGLYDNENYPSSDFEYKENYYKRLKNVLSGVNTDWLSKPLRVGVGQKYNLRLEGGSEEFRWGASLSYNDTQGAMKGSYRRTFNGAVILMYNLKNLMFRNQTSIGVNSGKESNYGNFSNYVNQEPYERPYDENGTVVRYFDSFYPGGESTQSPLYDANLNSFDKNGYLEVINNFSIDWNILESLRLRGQLGISTNRNTSDYFLPAEHSYFNNKTYQSDDGFFRRGLYKYGTGDSFDLDGNVTLSYSKLFKDKHQVYVGLDYSISTSNSKLYNFNVEGFTDENLSFLPNALQYAENTKPSGSKSISRRIGFTGNANYTYDNRYYIDGSYRMDGSSQFGTNKKFAPFWSLGVGWNMHNEKFLQGNPILNTLRLKASYGETGSQQFSSISARTTYHYLTNNKYVNWTGATLAGLGNPDLTWQKTTQLNIGTEFGFLENRVFGSFDYYVKKTANLLSSMNLPLSMGFPSYVNNIGEVKNTGFEAALSVYVIRNREKNINWIVSGQLVYNKNEITKLSDDIKEQNEKFMKMTKDVPDVSNLFYEGNPQNSIYAVRSLGIDPSYGKEMFLDKNGNITETWNAADKVFMGSADPVYRGNASSTVMWKNLTFNISFGYHWGGKMYNQTLRDRVEVSTGNIAARNVDKRVLEDRWIKAGDAVFFKGFSSNVTRASSRYVMDDRLFEIQSIGLQYRWDTMKLRKATGVQSITFGVNMSDVLYLSSVKNERGIEYPFARAIKGTISLLF